MNEIMKIDTIQQYNDYFGVEGEAAKLVFIFFRGM